MAAVTGDEHGQVRILLHGLHWDGCKGNKYSGPVFFPFMPTIYIFGASDVTLYGKPGEAAGPYHGKGRRHHRQRSDTASAPAQISACGPDWHRGNSRHWSDSQTLWR